MIERGFQTDELPGAPGTGSRYSRNSVMVDLVGMSPTTSSTMERKWQPEIDSKAVNYRRIGKKQVYRAIFPANFRPTLMCKTTELHGRGVSSRAAVGKQNSIPLIFSADSFPAAETVNNKAMYK